MSDITDKYDGRLDAAEAVVREVRKEVNKELGIGPEDNPHEIDRMGERDLSKRELIALARNVYDAEFHLSDRTGT